MFESYDKKSSFSRFMAVFISYYPHFRVYWEIYNDHYTRYMLESYNKNSSFEGMTKNSSFGVYGRFHELLPIVLGLHGGLHGP